MIFRLKSKTVSTESQVEEIIERMMSDKIKSKLDERIEPPRSAPSIVPQNSKEKKHVRYSSEPAIVFRSRSGNSHSQSDKDSLSQFETKFSNCSNFMSDISCSKSASIRSSCLKTNTRTIGTNYSSLDCG